jgi:uncharacterized protein (DUF342 family)
MIAVRTFFKSTPARKPRASKVRPGESTGDLVRGDEPLHGGMETMGSILVGGRASRRTVGKVVSAKSSVGSNSLGADSSGADSVTERDCGA